MDEPCFMESEDYGLTVNIHSVALWTPISGELWALQINFRKYFTYTQTGHR